jgi:hypothetical protein
MEIPLRRARWGMGRSAELCGGFPGIRSYHGLREDGVQVVPQLHRLLA